MTTNEENLPERGVVVTTATTSETYLSTEKEKSGIAMLPPTDNRPIGIVGMDGDTEELKRVSETLTQIGLTHIVMSVEEAEAEGITREDLLDALLSQKIDSSMALPKVKKSTNVTQKASKRKKKGKKTHRK